MDSFGLRRQSRPFRSSPTFERGVAHDRTRPSGPGNTREGYRPLSDRIKMIFSRGSASLRFSMVWDPSTRSLQRLLDAEDGRWLLLTDLSGRWPASPIWTLRRRRSPMTPEVSVDGSDARNDELLKQTAGPKAGSLCISGMETSQGPAATLNKGFLEHDTRHFMNTLSWGVHECADRRISPAWPAVSTG